MKLRLLRPARQELADAIHYYNVQQAGLGDAFRNESRATLQRIREFPLAWQALGGAHPSLPDATFSVWRHLRACGYRDHCDCRRAPAP